MTTPLAPYADCLPPVERDTSPVSLATLTIDLGAVARFPATLLQKRSFLPFGWRENALCAVVPPRFPRNVADEVAFAAGAPLVLVEASDGNLPKLIQKAIAALAKGERVLEPASPDAPSLGSDLVYLEDLGALGATTAPSGAPIDSGPSGAGAGWPLGEPMAKTARPSPHAKAPPLQPRVSDPLPPVVDLELSVRAAPSPGAISSSPPPAPRATFKEATRAVARDEDLIEDPDAPDLDLLSLQELVGDASGPRALLVGTETPESERLSQALRSFGLRVTGAAVEDAEIALSSCAAPALMAFELAAPSDDVLVALRRLRSDERDAARRIVVVLFAPWELEGWQLEADFQTTYGADLVLGPHWQAPLLRRRLGAAFRARTGEEIQLRPGPGETRALELSRRAAERYLDNRLEEAVSLFEEALASDPSLASAQVGLAMARVKQARHLDAIVAFERALAVDPMLFTALRNLAMLYEKRGFRRKAMDTWTRALEARPDAEQRHEILVRIEALVAKTP